MHPSSHPVVIERLMWQHFGDLPNGNGQVRSFTCIAPKTLTCSTGTGQRHFTINSDSSSSNSNRSSSAMQSKMHSLRGPHKSSSCVISSSRKRRRNCFYSSLCTLTLYTGNWHWNIALIFFFLHLPCKSFCQCLCC